MFQVYKSDGCTDKEALCMYVQEAESHVKKCRPIVCPHAGFLAQLQSWYYTVNKLSCEGVTESAHDIELLTLNESEVNEADELQTDS